MLIQDNLLGCWLRSDKISAKCFILGKKKLYNFTYYHFIQSKTELWQGSLSKGEGDDGCQLSVENIFHNTKIISPQLFTILHAVRYHPILWDFPDFDEQNNFF